MIWILCKAKTRKRFFQFAAQKGPAPLEKPQSLPLHFVQGKL
jgi:hypothetical protein